MSQHDYVIDNQTFPATRTDLNNALAAIVTQNAGATAPSTTYAYQFWYDSTNDILKMRNSDNDAWIDLFEVDQTNDTADIGGGTSFTLFEFTATSGQTTFSGADDNTATLDYTAGAIILTMNGIVLDPSDYTATDGTSVVLASGASAGDIINIHAFSAFDVADNVKASTGGTFSGGLVINGNVDINGNELILDADGDTSITADTDDQIDFKTGGSDRVTIDSSGNLLVGTATTAGVIGGSSVAGSYLAPDGGLFASRSGDAVAHLNRQTSDGEIIEFRKDGSTVGSIGSNSGVNLIIGTGDTGIYFNSGSDAVHAWNISTNSARDNAIDLGRSADRFDDIFATNGTIQTSDENEKQQIASLTSAEITAAKAISKLFKTFKWNSSVTENGDNARTHTGVIAQHVQTAMTDAGLDAGDYAFFISTTWWEADEDYTDDDGNAQTRTVTYDTQAEAPEGATERTRLGIRYPELLAFIGAATEQRLADIETRLTALENA